MSYTRPTQSYMHAAALKLIGTQTYKSTSGDAATKEKAANKAVDKLHAFQKDMYEKSKPRAESPNAEEAAKSSETV